MAHFFDNYFVSLNAAKINLTSDTIKLMLLGAGYTPNRGAHAFKSDVVAQEITGTGYTAGGTTIGSMATAIASNVVTISGANASWPAATFSANYAVLYDSTPSTDATRPLIGLLDFGGAQSPSAGTLSVTWNASGIGTVTDS